MHFSMTSRRSIPASRASSVGVRWIAIVQVPPVRFATLRQGSATGGRHQQQLLNTR
jgi:hypothetical protein